MNDTAMKFRIGVFVLAGMAILAVLVVLFSGAPALFTQYNRYTVVLDDAGGIGVGTPVRRSGVRIGQVEALELDPETGKVRIAILVQKKYSIRENEVPEPSRDFIGNTAIDFRPVMEEKESEEPAEEQQAPPAEEKKAPAPKPTNRAVVPPGSVIQGRSSADMQRLISEANRLLPNTEQALREIGKAAEAFNKIVPNFDAAVREVRDLSRATRQTIPEIRKTNDEAIVTIRNWGRLGERLDVLIRTEQDKVIKMIQDLDETAVRIGRTFNDENQRYFANTLRNLSTASDNFERLTKNTDAFVTDGRRSLDNVNKSLSQANDLMDTMQRAVKPIADRSDRTMKNFDESSERLNRTLADADTLLQSLLRSEGTFSKFVNDPSLYNNLNDASCMLLHILPKIDRMMKDLEVFTDKIARHPESLGVGGAVRPGSGIK